MSLPLPKSFKQVLKLAEPCSPVIMGCVWLWGVGTGLGKKHSKQPPPSLGWRLLGGHFNHHRLACNHRLMQLEVEELMPWATVVELGIDGGVGKGKARRASSQFPQDEKSDLEGLNHW